jgi:hypothetical protein
MTNRLEIFKSLLTASLFLLLIISIAFVFTGCGDDNDSPAEPETLSGVYQMQKVVTTADYLIGDVTIIPSGTDITEMAAAGILSAAPCSNPANGAVDLRDNGSLYLVCVGEEGELAAGTWTENSTLTTLSLNLSSPPFPQALQLSVVNITRTSSDITGDLNNLVLPADMIADLLPPGVDPPLAVILSVEVTFVKVD